MDFLLFEYPITIIPFDTAIIYMITIQCMLRIIERKRKSTSIEADTFHALTGIGGGIFALAVSLYYIATVGSDVTKLTLSWASLVFALAGIAGGALMKRRRKTAGVLMLTAAAGTFITVGGAILLLFGGIFTFVGTKKPGEVKLWMVLSPLFPVLMSGYVLTDYIDIPFFLVNAYYMLVGLFLLVITMLAVVDIVSIKQTEEK